MLLLWLTFGSFLGLDGQQGHDGNDQGDSPRDFREKVLDPEGINVPNRQIDDKGPFDALDVSEFVIPHNHIWFSPVIPLEGLEQDLSSRGIKCTKGSSVY